MVIEVSPFDFKYCVVLICRLKMSDRACFVDVPFGFLTNSGGLSVS